MNCKLLNLIIDIKSHSAQNKSKIYSDDHPAYSDKGWCCDCYDDWHGWSLNNQEIDQDIENFGLYQLREYLFGNRQSELLLFLNNEIESLKFNKKIESYFKLKAFW